MLGLLSLLKLKESNHQSQNPAKRLGVAYLCLTGWVCRHEVCWMPHSCLTGWVCGHEVWSAPNSCLTGCVMCWYVMPCWKRDIHWRSLVVHCDRGISSGRSLIFGDGENDWAMMAAGRFGEVLGSKPFD
eukprot:GHVN01072189.1.p1 GENE.GHVN01072189.1~~GHVN01072189.1.p1  ORF type:complete len:129 (-),score=11.83 GHVN01072189.1:182-568(-)